MHEEINRRRFIAATGAAGVGLTLARPAPASSDKPALLGGLRTRTEPFPSWPVFDESEEKALASTLHSGRWFRGSGQNVDRFEAAYAELMGAKYCIGTSGGTGALLASLNALGVGAGDEVILPPYTFVACVNVILMLNALPVFVDTDPETFQIDAQKVEPAITDRTVAIMPVHLGGNVVDLDTILEVAGRRRLAVVEDACQAHLAEWRGRKVGTFGNAGCYSFQASKNLTGGEGGAILTANDELAAKCYAAHNNGYPRPSGPLLMRGANLRMSEFHASLLLAQMQRLPEQAKRRDENAAYLTALLSEIPGILPARGYEGCTRNAYHLYMFRYKKEHFADLPRGRFLEALSAEGIPGSSGYRPLNRETFIQRTVRGRSYQRCFPPERLAAWEDRNACPENDRLCEQAVWFSQNILLAERQGMQQIAEAVRKIQRHAPDLARA